MDEQSRTVDPRLRVLFLFGAAFGLFFVRSLPILGAAFLLMAMLWFIVGLPARRFLRQIVKLWGLAVFVFVSFAFFENDPARDDWIHLPIGPLSIPINIGGLLIGAAMFVRVLTIIVASQVSRVGDARGIAAGLDKLHAPKSISLAMDAVLALLGSDERHGRGGGKGRGGGRGSGDAMGGEPNPDAKPSSQGGFIDSVKQIAKGDVGPIANRLELQIDRAQRHIHRNAPESMRDRLVDVAVIAGISLTMLGIKALKVLPNIPFAPGYKLVLLTPLYAVARIKTRGRFGATMTGLIMGTVAFLMGDGRYGVFEILKHVAPGMICDLLIPIFFTRPRGAIAWAILGGIIAVGRFATIFMVTLLLDVPLNAWMLRVPGLLIHVTFGIASGFMTHQLVKALRTAEGAAKVETSEATESKTETKEQASCEPGALPEESR